jgi:hypothetical protein
MKKDWEKGRRGEGVINSPTLLFSQSPLLFFLPSKILIS